MNSYSKLLLAILHNNKHLSRIFRFSHWFGRGGKFQKMVGITKSCKSSQGSTLSIFFNFSFGSYNLKNSITGETVEYSLERPLRFRDSICNHN